MVLDHNVTLSNDTVVMYVVSLVCLLPHHISLPLLRVWISSANAAAVAEKNFRIVHGPSDFFYLVSVQHTIKKPVLNIYFGRIAEPVNGSVLILLGKCLLRKKVTSGLTPAYFKNSNSWCDPFKTRQKVSIHLGSFAVSYSAHVQSYTFDPLANISEANAHLVLGGTTSYPY